MDLEEESFFSAEQGHHRSHSKKQKTKKSKHHDDTEELEEPGQDTDVVVVEESDLKGVSSSSRNKKNNLKQAGEVEEPAPSTSSKKAVAASKTVQKKTATKGLSAASASNVPNGVQRLATATNGIGVSDSGRKKVTKNGKAVAARSLKQSTTILRKAILNKTRSTSTLASEAVTRPSTSTSSGGATVETEEERTAIAAQIVATMPPEDIEELLKKIDLQCPVTECKSEKKREGLINWEEVAFSSYGPEQCKSVWLYIRAQARPFRILHEVVDEIRTKFKADYWRFMKKVIESSPGYPKQPPCHGTSGFEFFCKKLWHKYRILQARKKAKVGNYLKFQAKCYLEWPDVPDEMKEEYHKKAIALKAEHKLKVEEYYAKFPGFAPRTESLLDKDGNPENKKVLTGVYKRATLEVTDAPRLPFTPLQHFVNYKLNCLEPSPTLQELPELKNHYVEKWKELAESKKLKWIKKCVQNSEQYLKDLEEYQKGHPLYLLPKEFNITRFMSRDEYKIWAQAHGEPPKPCYKAVEVIREEFRSSGEFDDDENEMRQRAATKWEALDNYQKDIYRMKVKIQQMTFKKEFAAYYSKVPVVLREYAMEHVHKQFRRAIEEGAAKARLGLADDEELVGVNCEDEHIDIDLRSEKRKRNASPNYEASQEVDLEGDGSSLKKKMKKLKKDEEDELQDPLVTTSAG